MFTTLASTGEIISQQLFSAFGQTRTIYTAGGVAFGSMLPPTEQGFTGRRQLQNNKNLTQPIIVQLGI